MKRLIFIYPYITSYILPVLREMAESGRVKIFFVGSMLPKNLGFGEYTKFTHENIEWIELKELHPFGEKVGQYQKGILREIARISPDAVLIWSNPRFISFWLVIAYCHFTGIPVYPRGHGLVKKPKIDFIHTMMYRAILALSTKYICYTDNVKKSLEPLGVTKEKLPVDNNSLINSQPYPPNHKTGDEEGIFYLGRIREDCGVERLIEAVANINEQNDQQIKLHIIGDGPLGKIASELSKKFTWLNFYGKVFDEAEINRISRLCRFGCVPGFMGLNIVHMFSLSLPVVTHNVLVQHGPEAEYIDHLENGFFFAKPNDLDSLTTALLQVWSFPPAQMQKMQQKAFKIYTDLNSPPFFARMLDIMEF